MREVGQVLHQVRFLHYVVNIKRRNSLSFSFKIFAILFAASWVTVASSRISSTAQVHGGMSLPLPSAFSAKRQQSMLCLIVYNRLNIIRSHLSEYWSSPMVSEDVERASASSAMDIS